MTKNDNLKSNYLIFSEKKILKKENVNFKIFILSKKYLINDNYIKDEKI